MADCIFWHNLAEDFKNLDPAKVLSISSQYTSGVPGHHRYELEGGSEFLRLSFKRLAIKGARALEEPGNQSLFDVWCHRLRVSDPDPRNTGELIGPEQLSDGSRVYHLSGRIPDAAGASASLCLVLEIQEAERGHHSLTSATSGDVPGGADKTAKEALETASRWEDIELRFLSERGLQIMVNGKAGKTMNYSELGFEDRRTSNPNRAWILLLALPEFDGTISHVGQAERDWPKVERRMQEIRKLLRKHFGISEDPLPYIEGTGYRARFKIARGLSYDA